MALKNDAKFKEKLTFGFKYDMRNLVNFQPGTQKSQNLTLMSHFYPKYIKCELKNREELSFMTLNSAKKN